MVKSVEIDQEEFESFLCMCSQRAIRAIERILHLPKYAYNHDFDWARDAIRKEFESRT